MRQELCVVPWWLRKRMPFNWEQATLETRPSEEESPSFLPLVKGPSGIHQIGVHIIDKLDLEQISYLE
jgi:hypothetical protein